ncbi:SapC family protein, partial [Nostoc sp. NIES-2111]
MIREEDELRSRRYRFSRDFTHALGRALVPLIASELYNVCHEVPVLFAKGARGWDVVGIVTDPALRRPLVSPEGAWLGGYSPFLLRVHPFRPTPDDEAWEVDPVGLAQARERGRPFYLPDGTPAPEFVTIKAMLADASRGREVLKDHAARLEDAGLIAPVALTFVAETLSPGLASLFCVDALRLAEARPRLLAGLAAGSPSALDLAFASIYSMRLLRGHFDAAAAADLE